MEIKVGKIIEVLEPIPDRDWTHTTRRKLFGYTVVTVVFGDDYAPSHVRCEYDRMGKKSGWLQKGDITPVSVIVRCQRRH